jgi:hypothetical protein
MERDRGAAMDEERFWELETIRFQYLYVGLPALNAIEYLEGDNLLGVALSALMKIPADKVTWLGAEALRKIKDAPLPTSSVSCWASACKPTCRSMNGSRPNSRDLRAANLTRE